jgi:hypothetical protein
VLGQRINVWVAATALVVGVVWFVISFRRRGPEPEPALATAHEPSHVPTARPVAAIAARRASQHRRRH